MDLTRLESAEIVLRTASPSAWLQAVQADFDGFLLDHASAERKASAMAVSFVVQYPDRYALHQPMIRIAREELLHYQQVMRLIQQRGLLWQRDEKDPYIAALLARLRTDREGRLLDRLIVGGLVEARGVERFGLVATLHKGPLARFYQRLSTSEQGHATTFLTLAHHYFSESEIADRLDAWLDWEATAVLDLPIRAALH
ncbi:MAG: tRNA-(ms[2]io[6]A)-hydroxylase [Acidobacteria bacterium]|nr:tRNA-(ms[2]io[6]A)-hydroxylase [Acidobacteriota bacterium]